MATIDTDWIEARIAATKAMVIAYEDAILALSTGTQSYSLDTGQTRQTVTKANLSEMRNALSLLEDRLQFYANKLERTGPVRVNPAW